MDGLETTWTDLHFSGAAGPGRSEGALLVADAANPHHFLSVGEWRDSTARQAWADDPRFLEIFMPCLEVCDDPLQS